MKKSLVALLCLLLGCTLASSTLAQPAPQETIGVIQLEEPMLLEGKDIFTYTSGELYTLWQAYQKAGMTPAGSAIDYMGYTQAEGEDIPVPGLYFPFAGFQVGTWADWDDEDSQEVLALWELPLEETPYIPLLVQIDESGVPAPFGAEVGMTRETLKAKIPGLVERASQPEDRVDAEAVLALAYQNPLLPYQHLYLLEIFCENDVAFHISVSLEEKGM